MERFIWLLTFIPCRVLLFLLGIADFYLCTLLDEKGLLQGSWWYNDSILIAVVTILLVAAIACAIFGGKIGYEYVEMERSRRWHYHANKFDEYNSQLRNAFYWAGKFACFPIIFVLLAFFIYAINSFVQYC